MVPNLRHVGAGSAEEYAAEVAAAEEVAVPFLMERLWGMCVRCCPSTKSTCVAGFTSTNVLAVRPSTKVLALLALLVLMSLLCCRYVSTATLLQHCCNTAANLFSTSANVLAVLQVCADLCRTC